MSSQASQQPQQTRASDPADQPAFPPPGPEQEPAFEEDDELVTIDSINQQRVAPKSDDPVAQYVTEGFDKQNLLNKNTDSQYSQLLLRYSVGDISQPLSDTTTTSQQNPSVANDFPQEGISASVSAAGSSHLVTISQAPSLKVVPPLNFCPVERYLYRSGQPTPINHTFLKQLNIRNIVWLASEDPTDDFLEFADNNDINVHYIGGMSSDDGTTNPWDGLSQNSITQALQIIANRNYYPILVCCGMGRHRTGTVIGCLRRLQGWNLASVSEEYRRFTGSKGGRILVELLIEAFDIKSIKIDPKVAPDWLLS